MTRAKSIAIIAPVHSYRASVYLTAAAKHGISTIFISDGFADVIPAIIEGIRVKFTDLIEAKRIICESLDAYDVQAVLAPDEKFVKLAAEVSADLKLPHNSVHSLNIVSNKYLSRQCLKASGIDAVPDFKLINLQERIDKQLLEIRYPCVAKPLNLSASRGVIRADDHGELIDALERIKRILHTEFEHPDPLQAMVEEYVHGTEHALEGYLHEGDLEVICIFDKPNPLHGPYFEETYYTTPSRLPQSVQEQIRKSILNGCIAHGLNMGPIHAEVRVSGEKVWILEIAARSIGGDCGRIFELATHSSLEEFLVCRAIGQPVDTLGLEHAAGVLMMPVTENGILRRVEGVTKAQSVENVYEVRLDLREGEKLVRWPEGGKYPGFIYSIANSPERAEAALRESYSHLNFVCMPDLPVLVK